VAADNHTLDPTVSLQAAGLVDGDHLAAIVLEAKLVTEGTTFALFCSGGDRIVTSGLESPRSAEGCPADSSNCAGICCDPG
jgi:hypothetical protein